jgi:hypothetical protein
MANPTTSLGFSSSSPAPDNGYQNAKPRDTATTPLDVISFEVPNTGGAAVKTANYTATDADCGKNLVFNSASTVTLTLPGSIPFGQWQIAYQNIGAGTLTVDRNGKNIDGAAANLTVAQNSGAAIYTDGTNYFTSRGSGGGSTTFGTDIATIDPTHQKVIGLNTVPLDTAVSLTDGMTWQYNASTSKWVPVFDRATRPVSAVVGKPAAGQLVLIYTAEATETFPANFATPNSYGSCGVNPTSSAIYSVYKNTTAVGTVTISTSGVFTFATTSGAAFTLNAGDRLTMVAPGSQDTTLADVGITLVGTRGSVSGSTSAPAPALTWRGAYSGATAYNLYDVVSYNGSSYICILASTGNLPTNATYWNLMAQAGTNGSLTAADQQNQTYNYVAGSGSANTYVAAPGTAYGSLTQGQKIAVKISATNTGASTLNVSSLGAVAIKKLTSAGFVDPSAGDLQNNGIYEFEYNSTGPCWQMTGGGGGGAASGLVLLAAATASSSSSLDFTTRNAAGQSGNIFQSDFDEYEVHMVNMVLATSAAGLALRFTSNGGSSYDTSTIHDSASTYALASGSGGASGGQTNLSYIPVGINQYISGGSYPTGGKFTIPDPAQSSFYHFVYGHFYGRDNRDSTVQNQNFSGVYRNAVALNGFRITTTSGNLTSGIVRVYGVSK